MLVAILALLTLSLGMGVGGDDATTALDKMRDNIEKERFGKPPVPVTSLYMKPNETVQLQCEGPKNNITWYKEGNDCVSGWKITQLGNITVMYKNVTINDEGIFTCRLNDLDVIAYKVHVTAVPGHTHIDVNCADDPWLKCYGSGWYPKPDIKWTVNDRADVPMRTHAQQLPNGTWYIEAHIQGQPGKNWYECWIEVMARKEKRGGRFVWETCGHEERQAMQWPTDKWWWICTVLSILLSFKTIWWAYFIRERLAMPPQGQYQPPRNQDN